MPTKAYKTDSFQKIISSTLAIFFILSFLYPISRIVQSLVMDKETRIKELMKIMGLNNFVYDFSWFITLFIQMTIISLLITFVTSTTIYQYSNKLLIFIYFELFSISIINGCFLLSTFFNHSKNAAMLSPIIFFISFFPFYTIKDPQFSIYMKMIFSLFSPTCFALGSQVISIFESGLVGIHFNQTNQFIDNYNYNICILMLIIDSILYALLAILFNNILPSEYGTQTKLSVILTKDYWINNSFVSYFTTFLNRFNNNQNNIKYSELSSNSEHGNIELQNFNQQTNIISNKWIETIPNELLSQIIENKTLSIRQLTKIYETTNNTKHIAVNNINADLFEGQITVLLGKNGAGLLLLFFIAYSLTYSIDYINLTLFLYSFNSKLLLLNREFNLILFTFI